MYAIRIGEPESRTVAAIFSDITERRRTAIELARLAEIVENSHDAIVGEIEKRFGGVSDALNATLTTDLDPGLTPDLIQDIQRLPSRFRTFRTDWTLPPH